MTDKRERGRELLFLLAIGIFMFLWSVIQPYDSSPDEAMRYDICEFIYENHSLPEGGEPSIRNADWGYSYAFYPILSYMVGAVFMMAASLFSKDALVLLMAARMVSILCGVAMAWFVIRIGDKIWKKKAFKWLFVCLVTLLPQCVFIFTYVNNDSLSMLATAMIIYAWIVGLESKWNYKSCMLLSVGIIFCALSYYNAYGVILASMLIYAISIFQERRDKELCCGIFKRGVLIAVIVLAGIAWWFIRSYILYDGDFLGIATSEHYSQLYAVEHIKPSNRSTPHNTGMSLLQMIFPGKWLMYTVMSFIGLFGYMSIPLQIWMYKIYIAFICIGVLGFFIRKRREDEFQISWMFYGGLLMTAIIPNILNLTHSYLVDFQPQGRYSFPMLIPLMFFVTQGMQKLGRRNSWFAGALAVIWSLAAVYIYVVIFRAQYV